ncbi:hypothetical protein Tco_0717513 [Tanacetum coccineum]
MMARGAPNLAKRDLRNLQTTRASLVGSAFASTHFDRPKESGIKDLFGGEICTVMSPSGSWCCAGTDISQKDEKPSKKQQNKTRDGKVYEDEAKSKSSQLREEKAKKNIT